MTPLGPLSRQVQVFFVFFATFALAVLQNVTVDDAVLTGTVVPEYLPLENWNMGNICTACAVQPDPAQAYNGTWHDATYNPKNNYTQVFDFTFTGSALYIFFIIANNIPNVPTFTDVYFTLDGVTVGRYTHDPSSSSDYQYNVPVYVNESIVQGEHKMVVQPANSGNYVLMLFDYFIYTIESVDTSSSVSSTPTVVTSVVSATPSVSQTPSSSSKKTDIGAIVGGAVGGVAAIVVTAVFLLCYRRYKKSDSVPPPIRERPTMEPFPLSRDMAPTPTTESSVNSNTLNGLPVSQLMRKSGASVATPPPLVLPTSTTSLLSSVVPSPSGVSGDAALREQVELLRDEVARLRHMQNVDRTTDAFRTEAPPEYS